MRSIGLQTAAALVVLVGACTSAPPAPNTAAPSIPLQTPGVSAAPGGGSRNLGEALSFLTPDTDKFLFDDWTAIKESLGASGVTGASSEEEQARVLNDGFHLPRPEPGQSPIVCSIDVCSRFEYVVGGYGYDTGLAHVAKWGFDVLDYEWDATLKSKSRAAVYVVRLRDDFDLDQLTDLFDERGYSSEPLGSASLRTHPMDPSADWARGELAILNVAILEDQHTLLLSTYDDAVRSVLASEPPAAPAYVIATAAALGSPFTAYMTIGYDGDCDGILVTPDLAGRIDHLAAWNAMGIGYDRGLDPIGRIAFGYGDALTAEHELTSRRLLAEEGYSYLVGQPLAESAFAVVDASANEGVVRLDVSPQDGRPQLMFEIGPGPDRC